MVEMILIAYVFGTKMMFTNKQNGGRRKEFINYTFVFDKTFGLVPT